MTRMAFARTPSLCARAWIASRRGPGSSGVNLLKSGAITRGYSREMPSCRVEVARNAHTHQDLPAAAIIQNRPSRTGMPRRADSARPFAVSATKSRGVDRLNPNLASTRKVE